MGSLFNSDKTRRLIPALAVALTALFVLVAGSKPDTASSATTAQPAAKAFKPDPATYRDSAVPAGATEAKGDEEIKLSDEKKLSRWAFVLRRTVARSAPSNRARRVGKLSTMTPDGTAELVLLLKRHTDAEGNVWVQVRLPKRPNNTTGWVARHHLGRYRVVRTRLLINTKTTRATLYKSGKRVWSARIGVGTRANPTPRGNFYIRSRLIPVKKNGVYGIFAFGLSAYSDTLSDWPGGGMVGIHGTNQPRLIPGRISHGCIRVRNGNMKRLKRLMSVGTPVEVR